MNKLRHQEREKMKALACKLADAQATVEALQRERDEANLYRDQARANQESLAACVDRDVRKIKDLQAALDAERERSEKQAEEAMVVFSKLTQLQALVRALPVVEVDGVTVWAAPDESGWFVSKRPAPTGTYWAQFKTQEEADSFLALLRYRAALDATTSVPRQRQVHSCEIPGCVSCANPEEGGDDD